MKMPAQKRNLASLYHLSCLGVAFSHACSAYAVAGKKTLASESCARKAQEGQTGSNKSALAAAPSYVTMAEASYQPQPLNL